jgi:filamentous hemagglutinin family protein
VLALIPQGSASAQHLPTGGTVATGTAAIVQPNATTLNINQSTNQAIINWNTFSVGSGNTVNFNQPSAASSTLNRVLGSTPSWIAGTINAPGTVLLINPNGIEITKSGVVNTGSFAASTLNITDSDYLSGRYKFTGNGGSAGVINNGRINTADGGFAALLGGQVSNNGIISARLGKIALGAGEEATLDLSGDGFLSVGVPSSELGKLVNANGALVSNRGKIIADGGTVFLSAAAAANILRNAVNIPGSIRTNSVGMHNGRIVINGSGGSVSITGKLAANGGKKHDGGNIAVSGGSVSVTGELAANGKTGGAISVIGDNTLALAGTLVAQGYRGQGGEIDLTAGTVTLTGATVNASGTSGGGIVEIGGNFEAGKGDPSSPLYREFIGDFGSLPALTLAQSVSIDAATTINVSATNSGNAGTVIVWSAQETDFAGSIIGIGGPNGGNGGYAEVSSHNILNFTGTVDLLGVNSGTTGTLLLDPTDVTVSTGATSNETLSSGTYTPSGTDPAVINTTDLQNALGGANIVVTTTSSGNDNGTITVSSPISWSNFNTLTLSAANTITINAGITNSSGGLVLTSTGSGSSGNISIATAVSVGSLSMNTAGTVTQSAPITAANLLLQGSGGTYTLTNSLNSIGTLAADTGTISVNDASSLAIGIVAGTAGVTSSGAIALTTSGSLTIAAGASVSAGGTGNDVVLAAADNFINNAGSNAVSASGNWLIYSGAPGTDTFGPGNSSTYLNSNNTAIWDATITTLPPANAPTGGNYYIFAYQPTLTFTSTNVSKTYGTDDTAAVASAYSVSGLQAGVSGAFLGDTVANVYSGAPSVSSAGSAASATVLAPGPTYAITIGQGTLTSLDGYTFSFASTGNLTVNQLALIATIAPVTTTYGAPAATGAVTFTNVISGDIVNPAAATLVSPVNSTSGNLDAGSYKQTVSGTLSGADAGNYSFTGFTMATSNYTVNQLALTYSVANALSISGTLATLGAATLNGVVGKDNVMGTVGAFTLGGTHVTLSPLTPTGTYAEKVTGFTGADAGNYAIANSGNSPGTLVVAPINNPGGSVTPTGTSGGTTITIQPAAAHAPPLTAGLAAPSTTGALGDLPRVFDIPAPTETHFIQNEVVVQVNCDTPQQAIDTVAHDMHLSIIASKCMDQSHKMLLRLRINSGHSVADVIRALERFQIIAVAQPNYGYQAQPDAQRADQAVQTEANAAIQYALAKLDLTAIHQIATGLGIKIAVIDSQIDVKNPELVGNIAGEFDAVGTAEPPDVHGTEMAGVIAAHDRLTGVAPGAQIYAIHAFSRAGDSFGSSTFNIVNALDWAIGQGVRVINMSFTGPRDPSIDRALQVAHDKGIVLVAAAGNSGPDSPPLYPGADPNVIAVTATDSNDMVFSGANRGNYISVAAPGVDIAVPAPDATYQLTTGTSVAAAEVSGVVALLLQRNPALTPDDVRSILTSTARHPGTEERNDTYGWGLIDLAKAIQAATEVKPAPSQ